MLERKDSITKTAEDKVVIPSSTDVARKAALVGAGLGLVGIPLGLLISGLPKSKVKRIILPMTIAGTLAGAGSGALAGATGVGLHKILARLMGKKIKKKKKVGLYDAIAYTSVGTISGSIIPVAPLVGLLGNLIKYDE